MQVDFFLPSFYPVCKPVGRCHSELVFPPQFAGPNVNQLWNPHPQGILRSVLYQTARPLLIQSTIKLVTNIFFLLFLTSELFSSHAMSLSCNVSFTFSFILFIFSPPTSAILLYTSTCVLRFPSF